MTATLGHVLKGLLVGGGCYLQGLERIVERRDAHVITFIKEHVLEMHDVACIGSHPDARPTV